jgi:crotonobetainyl-CoA:carnitine CoA-transferase CaiB-like acyl-CoA transferase
MKHPGPLAGVRVIDLTAMVMGPYCTQIMADMGADVIKVEPPGADTTRYVSAGPEPGLGGVFHSMRAKAVAALGFGYPEVAAVNPSIVYTNCYGYGRRGPDADLTAYDDIIQAECGLPSVQEQLTGEGQEVEVAMFETMASFMTATCPRWCTTISNGRLSWRRSGRRGRVSTWPPWSSASRSSAPSTPGWPRPSRSARRRNGWTCSGRSASRPPGWASIRQR